MEKVGTLYTDFVHALDYTVRSLCIVSEEKQVEINFDTAKVKNRNQEN